MFLTSALDKTDTSSQQNKLLLYIDICTILPPHDSVWHAARTSLTPIGTIPYSRKIWQGIKFGSLAVYLNNRQIKIRQNFLLAYMHMAIPY